MSHILRTVADDYTTVRLDLHTANLEWLPDQSSFPIPASVKGLSGFIDLPGEDVISEHYPNMPLRLAFYIKGTSANDLNDRINSLLAEFAMERILEVRPEGASTSVFYRTLAYDAAEAANSLHPLWRAGFHVYGFAIGMQVKPWCETSEQTLHIIKNDVLNPGFETYTGSGNTTDFANWTETRTNGTGTATVEAVTTTTYVLDGAACLHLKTTTADGTAKVESDFITVDKNKHYYFSFPAYPSGGVTNLTVYIDMYNTGGTLLGTLSFNYLTNALIEFRVYCGVIHNQYQTAEALYWNADTAKIKVGAKIANAIGEAWLDSVLLTEAERIEEAAYTSSTGNAYRIPQMYGYRLAPSELKGNMPSPMRIKLSKPLSPAISKALVGVASEYAPPLAANPRRHLLKNDMTITGSNSWEFPTDGYITVASGNYLMVGHFNDDTSDLVKVKVTSLAIKDPTLGTIRTINIDDIQFTEVDWTLAEPDTASPKRTVDHPPFTAPEGVDPNLRYYYTLGSDGTTGSWYLFFLGLLPTYGFARINPTQPYNWIDCYRGNAIVYTAASDDISKAVALAPASCQGNYLQVNPDGIVGAIAVICNKGNQFANHVLPLPDFSITYRPRYRFPVGT